MLLLESIHTRLLSYARDQFTRNVAILRTQLDEATFTAPWAEGSALTLEQVMTAATFLKLLFYS